MQTTSPKKPSYKSTIILLLVGLGLSPALYQFVSLWQEDDPSGLSATLGVVVFSIPSFLSITFLLLGIGKFISVRHRQSSTKASLASKTYDKK